MITEALDSQLERLTVIAAVALEARDRPMWEILRPEQIAAAHVDRVGSHARRENVDQALECEVGWRAGNPAIGTVRTRRRRHRPGPIAVVRKFVGPHDAGGAVEQLIERRIREDRVRATVHRDVRLEREEPSVGIRAQAEPDALLLAVR